MASALLKRYALKYSVASECLLLLVLLVVSGPKCIEIVKEIKLPDFLARSPGVVAEMLIPLGEVPGDRLLHLSGVRVVGVVDDGSRHSAQNSLNHIEKLRRCGKRHQFDDRANRQRSSFIVELIQR